MTYFNKYVAIVCLFFLPINSFSSEINDASALKGVKIGKVVFDVNIANAKKLTLYLMVVSETIKDLIKQGVKPDVILAFRGKSVLLVSKDRKNMELSDYGYLDKISTQLSKLQKQGARIEVCSVATRLFKVNNTTLLDGIKPVGNTFVSLTGYHAQGYASIPLH